MVDMNKNIPRAEHVNTPTILVVFGATGDLIGKKILPALLHISQKKALPDKFRAVGFSRRELSDASFREYLEEKLSHRLKTNQEKSAAREFLKLFSYERGQLDKKEDYIALAKALKRIDDEWGVCTNKLFYLAVPPELYEVILKNLAHSGLTNSCSPVDLSAKVSTSAEASAKEGGGPDDSAFVAASAKEAGWTRVIVEKPFGKDLSSARALDSLLGKLFKEEQIYRIDHYLAKEMLQNILTFRFANNLFERNWDNTSIEKIEVRLYEKIGVEDRGAFYDGVGALRDVGQNHLLQMLALATMEHPKNFNPDSIRSKRAELIAQLEAPTQSEIKKTTFRAQYEGYKKINGVKNGSHIETYFKVHARLASPRWQGTVITLESGKRLGEPKKDIIIHFKHPMPCLCPKDGPHHKNKIIIGIEPKEEIDVAFWSKKPGYGMDTEERKLNFLLREKSVVSQYTEEYEKLLLDCIAGNQTLFISTDEINAMWRYTDPIAAAWNKNLVPLETYAPDTDEITRVAEAKISEALQSPVKKQIQKEIAVIGLGKMGAGIARQLSEKGWRVLAYNRSPEKTQEIEKEDIEGIYSLAEISSRLSVPRIVWTMLPAGNATEEILFGKNGVLQYLKKGDIVVDAANSFYKDSIRRSKLLAKHGIRFLDAGVSGGPSGARNGASIMVGGDKKTYEALLDLWKDLTVPGGFGYMGSAGAGHFVKMVHNGIEYGMMQAIGEGYEVLKKSKYKLNLEDVTNVYSRGTVIESRLISWLKRALEVHGEDLKGVSGSVHHTGEGAWTVKTAKEEKVKAKIIEEALKFRIASEKSPTFTGKVVSALREQFGGHDVSAQKKRK